MSRARLIDNQRIPSMAKEDDGDDAGPTRLLDGLGLLTRLDPLLLRLDSRPPVRSEPGLPLSTEYPEES